MGFLTNYNLLIESIPSHISECVLSHLQSGCFFERDLDHLFSRGDASVDRRIKRHLSVPAIFPSIQSVIPNYAPSTALSVCRDSSAGVYHDLVTGKCISRIARDVYTKSSTDSLSDLSATCTHLAAAEDSGSPLVFLASALGDINIIDLRVGVKGEFGHPVMSLLGCHTGAISCLYNFRGYSFSLASGGYEDGKLNFFDLRYPFDHLKSPYSERPMPLRSFEVHLRNQTKYVDMDETDQQILKHMKLGRITSMAASHDERLLAISNGQSELVICTTQEDVRVVKMGFLSAKDDYATSLAFSKNDSHLYCATYDLLAAIARCKSHIKSKSDEVLGNEPYNMVVWPLLNFQSNDWMTVPLNKFSYSSDFELVEDMTSACLFGNVAEECDLAEDDSHDSGGRCNTDSDTNHTTSVTSKEGESVTDDDTTNSDSSNPRRNPVQKEGLRLISNHAAESCHRSYREKRSAKIQPLIFTVVGDYAVSTGGYETETPTIDVWDPLKQELLFSSSTPEVRGVRFEHICSRDDGTVLLSGSFERANGINDTQAGVNGLMNKCVCVMKQVSRDSLKSAADSGLLKCSFI
ncbi:hypothetical protein X943_002417 [Babesia divergens]|uniref:Uncharacterized protein n=1 Tax=Babesia divergens TaxID=32595 RepID=A0AAD9G7D8_BABDI|nr:hypothetical protein X943_002417 [Babesia divergens]